MREIDDQYQEYAPAHCPRGRGRHHGPLHGSEALSFARRQRRLTLSKKGFLTGVGVIILIAALMGAPRTPDPAPSPDPSPRPVPTVIPVPSPTPTLPPTITPTPTPSPEPTETPTPAPTDTPIPTPTETLTPTPTETPSPTPTPTRRPTPTPTRRPTPTPTRRPTPTPTRKPTPTPTPIPTITPTSIPTPTPTPKPTTTPTPTPTTTPTPTPTTTPTPTPTTTPTPEYTPPYFKKLDSNYEQEAPVEGHDGKYLFHYKFEFELEDADTTKPITAHLQYAAKDGTGWQDCPEGDGLQTVATLTYSGSGTTWSDEMLYDIYPIYLDWENGELGMIQQVRIVCDYTLKDGTEGTVYSTDKKELYAYKGRYVTPNPDSSGNAAFYVDDGIEFHLKLLTDLLFDLSKVSLDDEKEDYEEGDPYALFIEMNDNYYRVPSNKVTMSAPDENGTFTIFCPWDAFLGDGEEPYPDEGDFVLAYFFYNDKDDAIKWYCSAWADTVIGNNRNAPVVELSPYVIGPPEDEAECPTLEFTMTLNDLKGGSAVATLYVDTGNGFVEAPEKEYLPHILEYDPSVETGDTWGSYIFCPIDPPEGGGIAGKAKIVFDIVYPDGETDTIETETRPVHNGSYAEINMNYGKSKDGWDSGETVDTETGNTLYTLSFDVIVDDTLVVPAEVNSDNDFMWCMEPSTYYYSKEIRRYTAADGTYHMHFTYASESPFPDSTYWFIPQLVWDEDDNNYWMSEPDLKFEKTPEISYEAPAFTSVSSVREYNPGIDDQYFDTHYYGFELELNDADISKPITAKLQYAEPGGTTWTDCTAVGESVVTLTYSGSGTTWTCEYELSYDVLNLDIGDAIGMLKEIRIAVDYTLPDGTTGTVYSTDLHKLFAYKGEYVEAVSSSYANNTVTATFRINKDFVHDLGKLKLKQLSLDSVKTGEPGKYRDIEEDASISAFASDGTFTVTYALSGETLDPEFDNSLIIVYEYSDYSYDTDRYAIDTWVSGAVETLKVPVLTAPVLNSYNLSTAGAGSADLKLPFDVKMNDAATVTAKLQWSSSENGTYAQCDTNSGTVTLTKDNTTNPVENWVTSSDSGDCLSSKLTISDELPGAIGWFRINFDYTLPGGKTGSFESDHALPKWYGSFFDIAPGEYIAVYYPGTGAGDGRLESVWAVYWDLTEGIQGPEDIKYLKINSATLVSPEGVDNPSDLTAKMGKATYTSSEKYLRVEIPFENLNLNDSDNCTLKLEMTYSYGNVNWTATKTVDILRLS